MRRILTAAEMREVDRSTIERGVPGIVLMENAASRVVEALAARFDPLLQQRIVVLCGKGNNGGDGLAVARGLLLRSLCSDLTTVLCCDPEDLRGDAAANLAMLRAVDVEPLVVRDFAEWMVVRGRVLRSTLIVDALLGTGLSGPVRGFSAELIEDLAVCCGHVRFAAVDIPSGMSSDSVHGAGMSLRADLTVTFTAPKVAQVLGVDTERMGELRVGAIGSADSLIDDLPGEPLLLSEAEDFTDLFAPRDPATHKGTYGHVTLVAGSRSKPGAAAMAGTAALRAGAGLATVVSAASVCPILVTRSPELMTVPVDELADGSISEASYQVEWFDRANVVAVGPGLGTSAENQALVRRIVSEAELPIVVDADGLTALAGLADADWEKLASKRVVLTPHPGEMSRLCGLTTEDIAKDRVAAARELAKRRGVVVVLKGHRSLIAAPDGKVVVNPTGTPAMATAGSGDVLTGLLAGLLAQHPDADLERVAAAAVYLHGRAGEIAADVHGEASMLATDMLEMLPDAIASILGE